MRHKKRSSALEGFEDDLKQYEKYIVFGFLLSWFPNHILNK
ncbi:hypothetical protein BSI_34990 [Bacillus inaquosorum KCTC 13429]|uniref:Uncharacterized protein n=1 Tax=Bacillus inaquosorum KCTC 13429 TaxID=1236548 RepID=A0A9W5LFU5_9BACI|nr:hypothetical protein BSI_34990 [Bacillus inaquosorum KCTC 13429]